MLEMLGVTFIVFVLVYLEFVIGLRFSLFHREQWSVNDGNYVKRVARQRSCLKHGCKQNCTNPEGWNLLGSDWGCCDNYDGCCQLASRVCYYHDKFCQCCNSWLCLWNCQPEPDCPNYKSYHQQLTVPETSAKKQKTEDSDTKLQTQLPVIENNETDTVKFSNLPSVEIRMKEKKKKLNKQNNKIDAHVLSSKTEYGINSESGEVEQAVVATKTENNEIDWMNVMLGDDPGSGE